MTFTDTKRGPEFWLAAMPLILMVACGDRSSGSLPGAGEAAGRSSEQVSSDQVDDGRDRPNANGPGLQGTSTDSLNLPVPRALDLSHVESSHFAAALGKDPSRIFEFVRDRIAFEAYAGCLRGPRGTLLAMAGNSVDRAALLATLLVNSGHRIRYAHGRLPESVAQDLVASIWAERPSAASAEAEEPSPDEKAGLEKLTAAIKRDGSTLAEYLKKAGYPDRGEPLVTREELIRETVDHYWVERWDDGEWIAMDPSFATATPGQVYVKAEETFDSLPEELFHGVEVRIQVEEYTGDTPSVREVLHYVAKAADLSGVDVFLSHEEVERDEGSEIRPVLVIEEEQVIGLPFSFSASGSNPAGGMADALGGFGGFGEEDESTPTTTAEFVELAFIAPGGRRETVMRDIFDRVGKKRRLNGERLSVENIATGGNDTSNAEYLLGGIYDFFVTTGAIHPDHLRGVATTSPQSEDEVDDVGAGLRMISIAFTAISDGLVGRISEKSGRIVRAYVDSPRVYVAELSASGGTPRLNLDLRRDKVRVVVSGFRREQLFIAEVMRGVVNGALEQFVVDFFAGGDQQQGSSQTPVVSTSLVFESALAEKTPTILLAKNSAGLTSTVSPDTRARIDESLATGQVIVAPGRPVSVAGARRFAWWQIDPRSGATIAVTDEGLHAATAEGVVIRTNKGTIVIRIRHGSRIYRVTTRNPAQAAKHVRNATSNFGQQGVQVQWRGVVELWESMLL